VLARHLLDLAPGPLVPLSREAIDKFKLNFNAGPQLPAGATHKALDLLIVANANQALEGPVLEVASRWLHGLCPLLPVLGDYHVD
jgi:hypothetical protein